LKIFKNGILFYFDGDMGKGKENFSQDEWTHSRGILPEKYG
jgi:hypothetical protein